jgi:hypothetical protein
MIFEARVDQMGKGKEIVENELEKHK